MNAPEDRLRHAIDREHDRLRADVPTQREEAILALLRAQDRTPESAGVDPVPDLVTGQRIPGLGWNLALRLCLESIDTQSGLAGGHMDDWAERFLEACGRLAEAELVLAHRETGFMRMIERDDGAFRAWITTKRVPVTWRERADIDWWAGRLARQYAPMPRSGDVQQIAAVYLNMMAYQHGYPLDAAIGGCTIETYHDVLGLLIAIALKARDRGEMAVSRSERELVAMVASALGIDPGIAGQAVNAFVLDLEHTAWHAAVPGIAAAPIVRIAPDRLALSIHGLTTEPLLFLTRELRRRTGSEYHNVAHLREGVFRRDLFALFQDSRFVTRDARIELRRESGNIRTDIDAAIFDRKTGALGIFELKSQEPFARSVAELTRQRDNMLQASRQVSGILDWLQRHGPDEILNRIDRRTAKNFRVRKVYPFVLGRYLAHFNDGQTPDRRAAWGTWPQVLRLLDGQHGNTTDANPIASLFTRLRNDAVVEVDLPHEMAPQQIQFGSTRVTVHRSWPALQTQVHLEGHT